MLGACLCGNIRFEVLGPLPKLYHCHCSLCRKQSGSSSNSSLLVRATRFRWIAGEDKIARYAKDSGYRSHFCSVCGSPVPNPLRESGHIWVPAGLLDDAGQLDVGAHICLASKASWDHALVSGQHFEQAPDLDAFIALLESGD